MAKRTMALLISILLLFSSLTMMPLALGLEQKSFSDNVLVSGDDPDHLSQSNPSMAIGPHGEIFVVWEEANDLGVRNIYFARSLDGGLSFSNKTRISPVEGEQGGPEICVNETGGIFLTWSEQGNEGNQTMFCYSQDGGSNFSTPLKVSPSLGAQLNPDIAVSGEMVYICWGEENETERHIMFTRSEDGGHSFHPSYQVEDPDTGLIHKFPSIAAQNQSVFIAWHDGRSDQGLEIYGSWSNDSGVSFPADVKVSDGALGVRQSRPDVEFLPQGDVVVVWQDNRNGDLDVRAAISMGLGFSSSVRVDDAPSGTDQDYPSVAVDSGGNISVAFRDERTGNPHISLARSGSGEEGFSSSLRVDDAESDLMAQGAPSVDIGEDNLPIVVFEDRRTGDWNIMLSKMVNIPPMCQISSPLDGEAVSDWIVFTGSATDPDGNDSRLQVDVRVFGVGGRYDSDWMRAAGNSNWSLDFNTSTVLNGEYMVEVRAFDGRAYSGLVSIVISVENEVQLWPDLAFDGNITHSPRDIEAGQTVIISVKVTNSGNVPAHDIEVDFTRGNVNIGSRTINSIDPGETENVFITWVALEGLHTIKVYLDPEDSIWEIVETNNVIADQVLVHPAGYWRPDLRVSQADISITPATLKDGDQAQITVVVYNEGRTNASEVPVLLRIDGEDQANLTIDTIEADGSRSISFNWTAEDGDHLIEVLVDPHNATDELDEGNNQASLTAEVELVPTFPSWYILAAIVVVIAIVAMVVGFLRWRGSG